MVERYPIQELTFRGKLNHPGKVINLAPKKAVIPTHDHGDARRWKKKTGSRIGQEIIEIERN